MRDGTRGATMLGIMELAVRVNVFWVNARWSTARVSIWGRGAAAAVTYGDEGAPPTPPVSADRMAGSLAPGCVAVLTPIGARV